MHEHEQPIRRYNLSNLAREVLQRTAVKERVNYGTGTYLRAAPWTNVSGDTEYNLHANSYEGKYTLTEHKKAGGGKFVFSFAPGDPRIEQSPSPDTSPKTFDPISLHYKLQRILLRSGAAPDAVPEPVGTDETMREQFYRSALNWQMGNLSVMNLLDDELLERRRERVDMLISEAFQSTDRLGRLGIFHKLFLESSRTIFHTDDETMFHMHLEDGLQERYSDLFSELEGSAE